MSCLARFARTWSGACCTTNARLQIVRPTRNHARTLSNPPRPPVDDEMDEFMNIDALDGSAPVEDDVQEDRSAVDSLASAPYDMTPEEAKKLVESLVKAASCSALPNVAARSAPLHMTRDTMKILRAARIVTTSVFSVEKDPLPITAAVGVRVDLSDLGLSRLANAALEEIAGPRVKDGVFTVKARQFATMEENMAHGVSLAGRAVAEAQLAVGEPVDLEPLTSWEEVIAEARSVISDDSDEVRALVDHVASSESAGVEVPDASRPARALPKTGLEAVGDVGRALHASGKPA